MNLKRILVAVNPADGRAAAFEHALALAESSGAELYLLHAVPANQLFSFRPARRLARMAAMRTRAEGVGVRVHAVEQHGDPAEVIELHANAGGVDLIVLGGDARRGWRRRSSVAERVIRRTSVPTLVVGSGERHGLRRILTPFDFSMASAAALRTSADLARRHGARVTVVHALADVPRHSVFSGSEAWKVVRRLPAQLEAAAARLRRKAAFFGVTDVDAEVATGDADRAILEIASRTDPDLIVMGIARRSWLRRAVFGSTLRRVLRRAAAPVLVIPVAAGARAWPDGHDVGRSSLASSSGSAVRRSAA